MLEGTYHRYLKDTAYALCVKFGILIGMFFKLTSLDRPLTSLLPSTDATVFFYWTEEASLSPTVKKRRKTLKVIKNTHSDLALSFTTTHKNSKPPKRIVTNRNQLKAQQWNRLILLLTIKLSSLTTWP